MSRYASKALSAELYRLSGKWTCGYWYSYQDKIVKKTMADEKPGVPAYTIEYLLSMLPHGVLLTKKTVGYSAMLRNAVTDYDYIHVVGDTAADALAALAVELIQQRKDWLAY